MRDCVPVWCCISGALSRSTRVELCSDNQPGALLARTGPSSEERYVHIEHDASRRGAARPNIPTAAAGPAPVGAHYRTSTQPPLHLDTWRPMTRAACAYYQARSPGQTLSSSLRSDGGGRLLSV